MPHRCVTELKSSFDSWLQAFNYAISKNKIYQHDATCIHHDEDLWQSKIGARENAEAYRKQVNINDTTLDNEVLDNQNILWWMIMNLMTG